MSQSWRYTPPEGWEVSDPDYDGPSWVREDREAFDVDDIIAVGQAPGGIDGYEWAKAEVAKIEAARPRAQYCEYCGHYRTPINMVSDDQCQNCAERAYERSLSDFYCGDGPRPIQEQYEQAWKEKHRG